MKYLALLTGISIFILSTGCGSNSTNETIYVPKTDGANTINTSQTDTTGLPVNTTTLPDGSTVNTPILTTQQPVTPGTVSAGLNPEHGKPGHRCDLAVGAPLNNAAPQPQTIAPPTITNTPDISAKNATVVTTSKPAAAGMNPEHGKPGHRCDLAVGAPLDSKPAEAKPDQAPVVTTKSDVPFSPLKPGTTTPVTAGMNPEHGKPGHRCDIAVGDPLPKQ